MVKVRLISTLLVAAASLAPRAWAASVPRSLFGPDTRREVDDPANAPAAVQAAEAVAVLLPVDAVAAPGTDARELPGLSFGDKDHLCPGVRFRDQPAPGNCTGFLVGPDLLVTAGHCVRSSLDCDHVAVVFGFQEHKDGSDPTGVPASDVYACQQVVAHQVDQQTGVDFAVLRLDRPVEGRKPLALRASGRPRKGDAVTVIGHPDGLPLKIAAQGKVLATNEPGYFVTDSDAFTGNSGSPVLDDATGLVEGVVVRGDRDFDDTPAGCRVLHSCDGDKSCVGEQATRVGEFHDLIPPTGPSLLVTGATVTGADATGGLEPGGPAPLTIEVRNDGTVDLPATTATLASQTTGLTVTGTATLPPLRRGESATLTEFSATLAPTSECGAPGELVMTATPVGQTAGALTSLVHLPLGHLERLPFTITKTVPIPAGDPNGATLALPDVPAPHWRPVLVSVDIVHPDSDRLQVYVSTPNGRTILLHDYGLSPQGGFLARPTGRLTGTYGESLLSYESLRPLSWVWEPGAWTLKVVDHGVGSPGEIHGFGLIFADRQCRARVDGDL